MNSRHGLLVLNALFCLRPRTLWKALHAGDPGRLCTDPGYATCCFRQAGLTEKALNTLLNWQSFFDLDRELELLSLGAVRAIDYTMEEFPPALKPIPNAPAVLYVKGSIPAAAEALAIIGSREPCTYSLDAADLFSSAAACAGLVVISGCAQGIDRKAHEAAVREGRPTVAVLGAGLHGAQPVWRERLTEQILAAGGGIVSEFPLSFGARGIHYPLRNRIIAGLSKAVLVIQASLRSGSLITCRYALEYGKDVFVVPGQIGDSRFFGSNSLIRDGAYLVQEPGDILEEFMVKQPKPAYDTSAVCLEGPAHELDRIILNLLDNLPVSVDYIIMKSGMVRQDIMRSLMRLELGGLVDPLPGNLVQKRALYR